MAEPSGPGDQPSPSGRQLDRAPGERYRGGRPPGASRPAPASPADDTKATTVAILAALVVAAVGALLFAVISQVDLGFGLVAIAMFIGWTVALALVWNGAAIPRRPVVAAVIGGGAIVGALLLAWAWGRLEGGVLGPLDYVNERFGPVAYLEVAAAGLVAWFRSR
jgi:hypothetical protein